ncbi:unnamed protein product [Phytomonas sp. EM1]|nr:unnamed protein product [Phytomonas sp. EM1]|eukprot:CCW61606.1 unnamed protein product [Phytomonas sp. isolate EM1]
MATSNIFSAADHTSTSAPPVFQGIPIYLKPSSSTFRKPSFYIPRMRECVEATEAKKEIFRVDGLGSALPLFAISSASCEYYSLRLPLLKAGFKRLCAPLEGVVCNLVWGRSMPSHPLGVAASAPSAQAFSSMLAAGDALPPLLRDRLTSAAKDLGWAALLRMENPFQRFNHFPLSHRNLGCKRGMAANLRRIQFHIEGMRGGPESRSLPPDLYDFVPQTWVYPQEKEALLRIFRAAPSSERFIWKPARGSCGRGIYISQGGAAHTASWERVMEEIERKASGDQPGGRIYRQYVVQKYLDNPLLLNDKKMDLRLYVGVTSYDPLTVYLHEEGLVRLAAEPYDNDDGLLSSPPEEAMGLGEGALKWSASGPQEDGVEAQFINRFRHLTNYSIGRKYPAFRQLQQEGSLPQTRPSSGEVGASAVPPSGGILDPNDGHAEALAAMDRPLPELKWSLQRLWEYLDREHVTTDGSAASGRPFSTPSERLKEEIALIITRVLMSARPAILQGLRAQPGGTPSAIAPSMPARHDGFFELYGFDIMLDANLNPKLIEVNTMPSLESSSDFDYAVKSNVVADLLNLSMMEAFERPREALSPFLKQPDDLHSPDVAVRPYIHTLDLLSQERGGDQTARISFEIQRKEIASKLKDELQYARGFKRIFPPVSAEEVARQGASPSNYPIPALSHRAKKDLEAYSALGFLSQSDEWALQLS